MLATGRPISPLAGGTWHLLIYKAYTAYPGGYYSGKFEQVWIELAMKECSEFAVEGSASADAVDRKAPRWCSWDGTICWAQVKPESRSCWRWKSLSRLVLKRHPHPPNPDGWGPFVGLTSFGLNAVSRMFAVQFECLWISESLIFQIWMFLIVSPPKFLLLCILQSF